MCPRTANSGRAAPVPALRPPGRSRAGRGGVMRARILDVIDEALDSAEPATPGDAAWPSPQPLPGGPPAVEPFAPELLPIALRPWIADVAERVQCPPDYPA